MPKVICRNCKQMMTPRIIYSRGISAGWGWRIGGGKPISNCCPFCLSEHWDTDIQPSPVRSSILMKLMSIPLTIIFFGLLFGFFSWASNSLGGSTLLEWIGLIVTVVATYKFGRWFVN